MPKNDRNTKPSGCKFPFGYECHLDPRLSNICHLPLQAWLSTPKHWRNSSLFHQLELTILHKNNASSTPTLNLNFVAVPQFQFRRCRANVLELRQLRRFVSRNDVTNGSVRKSEFMCFVVGKSNYSLSDVKVQQNIQGNEIIRFVRYEKWRILDLKGFNDWSY